MSARGWLLLRRVYVAKPRGKYSLDDPVAQGTTVPCPNGVHSEPVLSAVRGTNADLFAEVAKLWMTPDDVIADVTAGERVFWRNVDPELTRFAYFSDLGDEDGTDYDCRDLPYETESLDVVVLDPPYQPIHENKWKGGTRGYYKLTIDTMQDVLDLYDAAIVEAARVLRSGGRLIVKCADMSFNHRLHLVHLDVLRSMTKAGFDLADLFVLLNTARMPQPIRATKQERARRAHSYFLVGVKA
jgi:hypothetical protein